MAKAPSSKIEKNTCMSSDWENRCLDARRVQTPSESYELLIVVGSHLFLMQLIKQFFFLRERRQT